MYSMIKFHAHYIENQNKLCRSPAVETLPKMHMENTQEVISLNFRRRLHCGNQIQFGKVNVRLGQVLGAVRL